MPNTPNNRPAGRQRINGGQGKSVSTHGPELGTGPVGKSDAYSARREGNKPSGGPGGGPDTHRSSGGGGGGERALPLSKGKLILIGVGVILLLIFAGKFLFNSSGDQNTNGSPTSGGILSGLLGGTGTDTGDSAASSGGFLQSLLGSFSGNSAYTEAGDWTGTNNTGKLNTGVASGARAKRTVLKGGGQDTVTLMVYMCGTDLESKSNRGMASADLKEMMSATISDKVNVIVYTGGCKKWANNVVKADVNQIYKLETGKLIPLDENRGKGAMTDPATLTDFISYCKTNYPADRNQLILWDHGGGTVSGYGYDEKNPTAGSLTLAKLSSAIKKAGVTFDFIGFDACLMATLETALVLDPVADYLIASEETEPGIGWYYTNWLTALSSNTSVSTVELGKMIVDDFVSTCAKKASGQKATLSVIDLAELSVTVGDKLSDFSTATANQISGSGYKAVSEARGNTREFGASSKIDQVDLVHLALNLNTAESKALVQTLLSAVKYNKTSSGVTNAYGISAYFPYRSANKVAGAVQQLDALGMDEEYTKCVKKFASLEVTGQAAGGGSASPAGSLFGSLTGSSGSSGGVSDLIGSLLGGGSASGGLDLTSLLGGVGLFDKSLTQEELTSMVEDVMLDDSLLVWTEENGQKVLKLTEAQWSNVADVQLNVFIDDGEGYIDLGLDAIFDWTDGGDLIGAYDNMWVALNGQPVAYYFMSCVEDGDTREYTGRVPVLLNGDRAELILVFEYTADSAAARVAGVRYIYTEGETDTVAKADVELQEGDIIQPICDRYTYDGDYDGSYALGEEIEVDDTFAVADVTLDPNDKPFAAYVLTDRFNMEHWTPKI